MNKVSLQTIRGEARVANARQQGYGYDYCNCPPNADTLAWKSSAPVYNKKSAETGLGIVASPNPAKTWVAFNYSLPLGTQNALIEISDMHGRIIATFDINTKISQKVWDIREVERGIYLFRITTGAQSEGGKLIIE